MRILVVEDEKKTASFIRKALQTEGYPVDGCGLGLSIAQWIVSAHHGVIRITSADHRTTVTVRLPLASGPEIS